MSSKFPALFQFFNSLDIFILFILLTLWKKNTTLTIKKWLNKNLGCEILKSAEKKFNSIKIANMNY